MPEITRDQVVEFLSDLSVMDIAALTKELESKWGVSAAPVAMMGGGGGGGEAAAAVEEKTEFNVELTAVGDKKINVIKVIRELTSLGLKEAKDLVDAAPKVVAKGRGLIIQDIGPKDELVGVAVGDKSFTVSGAGRGGKASEWQVSGRELTGYRGSRAKKGQPIPARLKPAGISG